MNPKEILEGMPNITNEQEDAIWKKNLTSMPLTIRVKMALMDISRLQRLLDAQHIAENFVPKPITRVADHALYCDSCGELISGGSLFSILTDFDQRVCAYCWLRIRKRDGK